MIVVTAADWRFRQGVLNLKESAAEFGYSFLAYDLGGLGFGTPQTVADEMFVKHGFYNHMNKKWKTKALHKPLVVSAALLGATEPVVYLDADTMLCDRIDEIVGDYSVGVTVRRPGELCSGIGRINAGVIFFNPGAADLVEEWAVLTREHGNDQRALNVLAERSPARFREFPTEVYNWYYFGEPKDGAKILHFKDNKEEMGSYIDAARRKRVV